MIEALTFVTWVVCNAHTCVTLGPDRSDLSTMIKCHDALLVKELYENRYDADVFVRCDVPAVPRTHLRPVVRPWVDQ